MVWYFALKTNQFGTISKEQIGEANKQKLGTASPPRDLPRWIEGRMTRITLSLVSIFLAVTGWAQTNLVPIASAQIPKGSNAVLTVSNFLTIKNFILTTGLSQTYCQMYNGNPYCGFEGMNAYLNPDTHQANINCDRTKSDFNTLVLQDHKPIGYWDVIWKTNQDMLVVQKPWSQISPDSLVKAVEDRFRHVLQEIEQRKQSNRLPVPDP